MPHYDVRMNAWLILAVVLVALVVLLEPLIRQSPEPPSKGEEAFKWTDAVAKILGGLWPR